MHSKTLHIFWAEIYFSDNFKNSEQLYLENTKMKKTDLNLFDSEHYVCTFFRQNKWSLFDMEGGGAGTRQELGQGRMSAVVRK